MLVAHRQDAGATLVIGTIDTGTGRWWESRLAKPVLLHGPGLNAAWLSANQSGKSGLPAPPVSGAGKPVSQPGPTPCNPSSACAGRRFHDAEAGLTHAKPMCAGTDMLGGEITVSRFEFWLATCHRAVTIGAEVLSAAVCHTIAASTTRSPMGHAGISCWTVARTWWAHVRLPTLLIGSVLHRDERGPEGARLWLARMEDQSRSSSYQP